MILFIFGCLMIAVLALGTALAELLGRAIEWYFNREKGARSENPLH